MLDGASHNLTHFSLNLPQASLFLLQEFWVAQWYFPFRLKKKQNSNMSFSPRSPFQSILERGRAKAARNQNYLSGHLAQMSILSALSLWPTNYHGSSKSNCLSWTRSFIQCVSILLSHSPVLISFVFTFPNPSAPLKPISPSFNVCAKCRPCALPPVHPLHCGPSRLLLKVLSFNHFF